MKFNLYIPNHKVKERWEKYAQKDGRSLSQFIRRAVEEKIKEMHRDESSGRP